MSYKPRTLFRLIEDINTSVFLPHIQRPFVWEEEQMLKLFDSLMRNYPIQTILFWRTKDEIKARKFMEQVEWDPDLSDLYEQNMSKAGVEKVFVLDGQQRIQTLYAIFRGAILSEAGVRQEAFFDVTSGDVIADTGLRYRLTFASEPLTPPWYRVADLLGKHAQRNAEELADELNETLGGLDAAKPEIDRETSDDQRASGAI